MKTKHFQVEVTKRLVGGEFWVNMNARQGQFAAYIFFDDPGQGYYRLREDTFWGSCGVMRSLLSPTSTRRFKTAVEAAKWIEEVRQHLIRLDAVYDERMRELESLPD